VAVVKGNAANIVKCVQDLKFKHVPCFAHTFSLAVKAAIHSDAQFSVIIEKCRKIVTFFHSSPNATTKLNSCCAANKKSKSKFVKECPTRWNSTFLMIRCLLGNIYSTVMKIIGDFLCLIYLDLRGEVNVALALCNRMDLVLDENEWEVLIGALQILQPCQYLTADLSSSSYPSISKVLPSAKILRDKIEGLSAAIDYTANHVALNTMCANLKQNISSRLGEYRMNTIHLVATYLDPR
jgi:hypothetical protein